MKKPPLESTQVATPDPIYDTPKSFPTPAHPQGNLPRWPAIVLLSVIIFAFLFQGFTMLSEQIEKARISQVVSTILPTPPTDVPPTGPTSFWKAHIDKTYNFIFQYPSSATAEVGKLNIGTKVRLKNSTEDIEVSVILFPTDQNTMYSAQPTVRTVTYDELTWNLHDESQFCEGMDNCGKVEANYTTKLNGKLVTIHLFKATPDSPLVKSVLASFHFTE